MPSIVSAHAYANNEVAYIAWAIDGKIEGCLGFDITRVYLTPDGEVAKRPDGSDDRVRCATWVSFKGQRNEDWLPQDTGVWPVQKLSWRDLTLRKKRDHAVRRPDEVHVRYEIRPCGDLKAGMEPLPDPTPKMVSVIKKDAHGKPVFDAAGKPVRVMAKAYQGPPRPLGYLGPAVSSNRILVTSRRGPFRSTFTNGILAAQWLRNVLMEDGRIDKDELINKLSNPADPIRKYLAGDVIPLIHELFARPGTFHLALYELEDRELEDILVANVARIRVILSNSAEDGDAGWDARNHDARQRLVAAGVDVQHRMFNNTTQIGHNKFVVHIPADGGARSVLTGSTNWTSTGLAGQTNNALLIEDDAVAQVFLEYWQRMHDDALALPNPLNQTMPDNQQGAVFRHSNAHSVTVTLANGATLETWFSPNMLARRKPTSKTKPTPVPPDLGVAYGLMRKAKRAILFLAFYPGQQGNDCIIGEAIDIGIKDPLASRDGRGVEPAGDAELRCDQKGRARPCRSRRQVSGDLRRRQRHHRARLPHRRSLLAGRFRGRATDRAQRYRRHHPRQAGRDRPAAARVHGDPRQPQPGLQGVVLERREHGDRPRRPGIGRGVRGAHPRCL